MSLEHDLFRWHDKPKLHHVYGRHFVEGPEIVDGIPSTDQLADAQLVEHSSEGWSGPLKPSGTPGLDAEDTDAYLLYAQQCCIAGIPIGERQQTPGHVTVERAQYACYRLCVEQKLFLGTLLEFEREYEIWKTPFGSLWNLRSNSDRTTGFRIKHKAVKEFLEAGR